MTIVARPHDWRNELSAAAVEYANRLPSEYSRSLFAAGYRRHLAGQTRNSRRFHAPDLQLLQEGWDFCKGEQQYADAMYEDICNERDHYADVAASTHGCW